MSLGLFIYFNGNNLTSFDLPGHFASAKFFSQGYFHSYNDNQFLGSVQNLFYPPLQDVIISVFSLFTNKNFVLAGTIYIGLVYLGFLWSLAYLSGIIKKILVRGVFLFLATCWLLLDKGTGIGIGLSLQDLLITGLSTQFLGAIFLCVLIRQVLENKHYLWIGLWLSLCFLSHIVGCLLAFAIVFAYAFQNRKFFYSLLLGMGLCALCWLPIAFHLNYIVNYQIVDHAQSRLIFFALLSVCLFFLVFIYKRKYTISFLLFGAFCIFVLNILGNDSYPTHLFYFFQTNLPLPKFHYYRLVVYAYLFLVLEFCLYFDNLTKSFRNSVLFALCSCALLFYFKEQGVHFIQQSRFFSLITQNNTSLGSEKDYNRTYFVPNGYPPDQNLSQYIQAQLPRNFLSAQGLYWESSKTNYLLSSYNAILFKDHSGVIDYVWQTPNNCEVEACFLDQFIRDYNIGSFIVDPQLSFNTLDPFQKSCLKQVFQNKKSISNEFVESGFLNLNYPQINRKFNMLQLKVRKNNPSAIENNSPLEVLADNVKVAIYDPNQPFYFSDYFVSIKNHCVNKEQFKEIYLPKDIALTQNENNLELKDIHFQRMGINRYEVRIDSREPVWFKIKLSWFPGIQLRNENGTPLPLHGGIAYMIGFGHGKMELVYERPPVFYLAYALSTISLVVYTIMLVLRSRPLFCFFKKRNSNN